MKTPARPRERRLDELLSGIEVVDGLEGIASAGPGPIHGITSDSAEVESGYLFVAYEGTSDDGHFFIPEAVRRGAVAVVAERAPAADVGVPLVRVRDGREALAGLAAAWHGWPARRLRLVGITGTVGKTSVLEMLRSILEADGREAGSIGSLGIAIGDDEELTGYTAPDPLLLHDGLARMVASGCDMALMEVTSHALVQGRVHGLEFDLGIFTNLVPLEHGDYHGSFREYVRAKARFFEHLAAGAPLIYLADDRAVGRLVRGRGLEAIGCGARRSACVRMEELELGGEGTRLTLRVRRELPTFTGRTVARGELPLELRLLGRSNAVNAALAATAALCLDCEPEAVRAALRSFPPPPRRMEFVHRGEFSVMDDTIGHPDSLTALFEVVERMAPRRLHIAFAVRGSRGARINRETAEALAVWSERLPVETLVVTSSVGAADELNRVEPRERRAFLAPLRRHRVPYVEVEELQGAVRAALEPAAPGDLVLLLGAQGMDRGAEVARRVLSGG